jgi:hypothetical protein
MGFKKTKTRVRELLYSTSNMKVKMCFLMDCTASMGDWIQAAKDEIRDIVHETQTTFPFTDFKVAFVGYRDYGDAERFVIVPFTLVQDLLEEIQNVYALGGDDLAEDVAGGMEKARELDWSDADVRSLFHIADAPPHGREYHNAATSDRYPRGDPSRLSPKNLIGSFSGLGVDYTFIRINGSTDKMVEVFFDHYVHGGEFKVVDLQNQTIHTPPLSPIGMSDRPPSLLLTPAVTRSMYVSIERSLTQDPTN